MSDPCKTFQSLEFLHKNRRQLQRETRDTWTIFTQTQQVGFKVFPWTAKYTNSHKTGLAPLFMWEEDKGSSEGGILWNWGVASESQQMFSVQHHGPTWEEQLKLGRGLLSRNLASVRGQEKKCQRTQQPSPWELEKKIPESLCVCPSLRNFWELD